MKNFKNYLACLTVFALMFSSCSKDESGVDSTTDKATLSFGAIVADLVNNSNNKQSDLDDLPECSDVAPSYVEIVLMQGDEYIVGEDAPYRVDLVAGQVFTEEDAALELEPGQYSLEHFAVYDAAGNLIWLAPKGGLLAEFVDAPLPLTINLGAGVKKYVDVTVVCYDDRDVNQYGYLFFEFDTTRAFEFCFFANYCPPNGRHFPARFSVEFSIDGTVIYEAAENINNVGVNNFGDNFADPICFALPDLSQYGDDEEYLDYTVTLLDWEGVYDAPANWVITGSLSRNEVMANFDGDDNVDYEHLQFGCDGTPPPNDCPAGQDPDGDGICSPVDDCPTVHQDDDEDGDCIPDDVDNCPMVANPDQADRDEDGFGDVCDLCPDIASETNVECPEIPGNDCDTAYMFGNQELNDLAYPGNNWGWGLMFDADGTFDDAYLVEANVYEFPLWAGAGQNDTSNGWQAGVVRIELDGTSVDVQIVLESGVTINESHIYFAETGWPESRAPGQLGNTYDADQSDDVHTFTYSGDGSFNIIIHGVTCQD